MNKNTILIIDDDVLILDLLSDVLRQEYRVLLADSPRMAQKILEVDKNIDLILADYNMPEMTGLEFLNNARTSHPHIKRVLISASIDMETVTNTFNNEVAHRVVMKPWKNEELKEILHEILCRKTPVAIAPGENQKILLSGSLKGIPLADIMEMLISNQKNGIFVFQNEKVGEIKIFIKNGRILDILSTSPLVGTQKTEIFEMKKGSYYFIEDNRYSANHFMPANEQVMVLC